MSTESQATVRGRERGRWPVAAFAVPLVDAMTTQRATRHLKADPVDDELVLRLLELATKASSGYNQQGWEFVVLRDRAVMADLAHANRQALGAYLGLGRWLKRKEMVGQPV